MQHNSYSQHKVDQIIKLFLEGKNPTEIARELGTYNTTIRRVLLRNDFELLGPSQTQATVKKNPFITGKKDASYWIGFISGDGNIYKTRVKIGLAPKDIDHLKDYIKFLSYELNILTDTNGEGKETKVVQFKNKRIANWFRSMGIVENKSLTLEVNPKILNWDFIRGVFDADGSIAIVGNRRLSVQIATASEKFRDQLISFLESQGLKPTSSYNNDIYIVRVCKQEDILNFWIKAYADSNYYLSRKAIRFLKGSLIQEWVSENIPNSGNPKATDLGSYGNPELAELFKSLGKCRDFTECT